MHPFAVIQTPSPVPSLFHNPPQITGVIYTSYFFSVVLYPYARYKAEAARSSSSTVKEDLAHRLAWLMQVWVWVWQRVRGGLLLVL